MGIINDAHQQMMQQEFVQQQPQQFTPEEIQNLKEIFDLFDKENSGQITIKDLEAIMQSLQRDPEEAKDLLRQIRQDVLDEIAE